MINIIIPMAGKGSRFQQAGYEKPKPFLPINGTPMISLVTRNLLEHCKQDINLIYVCLKEHYENFNLEKAIEDVIVTFDKGICLNFIQIDQVTEGAACTILLAKDKMELDKPLMVANSDQFMDPLAMKDWYDEVFRFENDGEIMTFKSNEQKWSYVKLNDYEKVIRVAEKKVISDQATTGIYWWKKAEDFVRSANLMIMKDVRHNGEFYVAPTYNEMIANNKKIGVVEIEKEHMHGLGTPEDLEKFKAWYKG